MKTPDEWMREFETKIADAQAKAAAVQRGLEGAQGSASSKDGSVSVTVAPNGALTNLRLSAEAMRLSHTQLASEIMAVARNAQRAAAVQVAETFEQVEGAGSESYQLITQYLPAPEEDEETPEPAKYGFEEELPVTEERPAAPRRMPRSDEGDDTDFGNGSIFRS